MMSGQAPGEHSADAARRPKSAARRWRGALLLAALATAALAARWTGGSDSIGRMVERLGPWGPVGLAIAYVPATVFLLPGTILSIAAGYFFGVFTGVAAVSVGSTAGAAAAFLLGRTAFRDWAERMIAEKPRLRSLDAAARRRGFLVVLLVRFTPALPFNLVNYAFSLTSVRFQDYLLGSWLGMLPGTTLYVYFGSTLERLSDASSGLAGSSTARQAAGLSAALLFTAATAWIARRELLRGKPPATTEPNGEPSTELRQRLGRD